MPSGGCQRVPKNSRNQGTDRRFTENPLQVFDFNRFGAEEGTRTPTPLRVHGPEPCASANSATSARRSPAREALDGQQLLVLQRLPPVSNAHPKS